MPRPQARKPLDAVEQPADAPKRAAGGTDPAFAHMRGHEVRTSRAIVLIGVLATLLVAALGLVSAARRIAAFQPVGFEVAREGSLWRVGEVSDRPTGLIEGDLLVFVAGVEPADRAELARRLRVNAETELLVLRSGEPLSVSYQRPPLTIDFAYLLLVLSGTASLAVGLYTVGRAPSDRGARLFFAWSVATAAVYLISHPPGFAYDSLARLGFLIEELGRLVLAPLTLHLFLVFPRDRETVGAPRWWPLLYAPACALALLHLGLFGGLGWPGGSSRGALQRLDQLVLAHLILGAGVAVATLIWRARRFTEAEPRRQAAWIALGLAAGYLPFLALELVPLMVGAQLPQLVRVVGVLPLSLVPLAFAWAILRYRLWDLGIVLRDGVASAVTLVLGGATFALLQLGIDRHLPGTLADSRPLVSAVAGLLTAGMLVPTRRGVRRRLERFIHLDRLENRQALIELGRALLAEHDPKRLESQLVDALRDGLGVDDVALLLLSDGRLRDRSGRFDLDPAGLGELWDRPILAIGPGVPGDPSRELQAILFEAGLRYALPLSAREDHIGLLALGYRQGELPLSSEDLELVASLAAPAALALENAHLLTALEARLAEVAQLTRRSENIIASSPAGIGLLDSSGVVQHANATLRSVVGSDPIGHHLDTLFPVAIPAADQGVQRVSFVDATGQERHLEMARSHNYFDGQEQDILVVQDVGERVAMERALMEKERLAALGMLAAGVAHEVNTPLTGISSYAQMLLATTPEGDERHDLLLKVERQTFRAARIVNDLLELARDRSDSVELVALDGVVHECLELLAHRTTAQQISVEVNLGAESALVAAVPIELEQIVTNLLVNAIDAMPAGGQLKLSLTSDQAAAHLSIADTGEGIASDNLDKIFRPFYSTKLAHGGTGLGLAITHQLVLRLGGEIRASSELGHGTTFELTFPRGGDTVH